MTNGGGALAGITVLDFTETIAGAIATMLLADQGAAVVKLEPPDGDPVRIEPGAQVWLRSKQSATVGLPKDRDRVLDLAGSADVVVTTWEPEVALAHGLADEDFASAQSSLIRCSITAYGDTRHAGRPDDPWLVAARTGLVWEQRGWSGGAVARMSGSAPNLPDLVAPPGCWDGTDRPGPILPAVPQPAIAAAYQAAIAITAALHARDETGIGQRVATTLLQGVLGATWGTWQRAERPDTPDYDSWVFDSRATRGLFEAGDGRWVCHWMPRPSFVLAVADGDRLVARDDIPTVAQDPGRILPAREDLVVLHHYHPELVETFKRFPATAWEQVAKEVGVALQPVRTPTEALLDPAFLADGSTIDVVDPRLGAIRQVGVGVRLHACPPPAATAPPGIGSRNGEVWGRPGPSAKQASAPSVPRPKGPLAGISVLDIGLAIAGPWGTQLLSDLGATVIKVNRRTDQYWHSGHMAMACNRGKTSLSLDLKKPAGLEVLRRLASQVDVVHHNMRVDAARRLGIWEDDLRPLNPRLIYCHTSGFDDSRAGLPGNDQTGAALAGVLYEDGGCADGGRPTWSLTSLGDIGNGYLSALGVLEALVYRDRTGLGQFVDTSIVRAQLLAMSSAWLDGNGRPNDRETLDRDQIGFSALRRLYETADGWLCIAARTDAHWRALCEVTHRPDLANDPSLATVEGREHAHDRLWTTFESVFASAPAAVWADLLDASGVPCEDCPQDVAPGIFDDPELISRGWVTSYVQGRVGRLDQLGLLFDFERTPARVAGPPLVVGDGSRQVLSDFGWTTKEIDRLVEDRVVYEHRDS